VFGLGSIHPLPMSHSSTSTLSDYVFTTLHLRLSHYTPDIRIVPALELWPTAGSESLPRDLPHHPAIKFAQQSPPSPQMHPKCVRGAQTWVPMSPPSGVSQISPYSPPPTLSIPHSPLYSIHLPRNRPGMTDLAACAIHSEAVKHVAAGWNSWIFIEVPKSYRPCRIPLFPHQNHYRHHQNHAGRHHPH